LPYFGGNTCPPSLAQARRAGLILASNMAFNAFSPNSLQPSANPTE